MTIIKHLVYMLIFLVWISSVSIAQKDIRIDDSLASHAEKITVKPGSQGFGKVWTIKFGEFSVIAGKRGWTTTNTRSNLLNTKTESKSTEKFSFTLANKTGDTAWVNAAHSVLVKQLNEVELLLGFTVGENELVESSDNFTAFIRINGDSSTEWALFLNITSRKDSIGDYSFFMFDRNKKIFISSIPDHQNKSAFAMEAAGYGFSDDASFCAALQYHGSGMMGANRMFIWIDNRMDPKMKLVMAAAMTSILQLKLSTPAPM